jgi:hypothetical protein
LLLCLEGNPANGNRREMDHPDTTGINPVARWGESFVVYLSARSTSKVRCISGASGASNVTTSRVMGCTNRRLRACSAWRESKSSPTGDGVDPFPGA